MDNSSSMSYTHMLNSSIPSHDPQNTSSLPANMDPSHFHMNHPSSQFAPMNHPSSQFAPNLQQFNPYHVNPFLAQPRSHQFIPPPSSYQGIPYQANFGQYSHGAYGGCASSSTASPVASMAYFGQVGGTPKVKKFNAVYNELKSVYASGQSEEQLMNKVRVKYMKDTNTKRPFPFEHWWQMVRKQQVWRSEFSFEEMNKRNKLTASGAYSSSNQETEGEEESARPSQGQKAAKAQQKGKDKAKAKCGAGILTNENVQQFNELQLRKSVAAEKMAAAALLQAENEKEKTKAEKLDKYLNLIDKDTSDYNDNQKKRHEQVVQYLAKELGLD